MFLITASFTPFLQYAGINWLIIILVIIVMIALLFFLTKQNKKDKKSLIKKLNEDYKKHDESESEVNDEV